MKRRLAFNHVPYKIIGRNKARIVFFTHPILPLFVLCGALVGSVQLSVHQSYDGIRYR